MAEQTSLGLGEVLKYSLSPHKRYIRKHLNEFSKNIQNSQLTIVDIGAGNSYYKNVFTKTSNVYISMDMQNLPGLSVVGIVERLPFRSSAADVVLLIEVLEHVYGTHDAIKEINRIIKHNGYLFITVPFIHGYHDTIDYFRFTETALQRLLRENGFDIIMTEKRGGIFACINAIIFNIPSILFKNKISYIFFAFLTPLIGILFLLDYMNLDRDKSHTLGIDILAVKQKRS